MLKRLIFTTGAVVLLCLSLRGTLSASPVDSGPVFVIENAETHDPAQYYDEHPNLIEKSDKMHTESKLSFHFVTGVVKDSGNIVR